MDKISLLSYILCIQLTMGMCMALFRAVLACEQALRGTGAGIEGEPLLLPQPQSLGEPARRLGPCRVVYGYAVGLCGPV